MTERPSCFYRRPLASSYLTPHSPFVVMMVSRYGSFLLPSASLSVSFPCHSTA